MCHTRVKTISPVNTFSTRRVATVLHSLRADMRISAVNETSELRRCLRRGVVANIHTEHELRNCCVIRAAAADWGISPNRRGSCLVISQSPPPRNWIRVNNFIKRITRHFKLNYCRNWEQYATVVRVILFSLAEQRDMSRASICCRALTLCYWQLLFLPSIVTSNKMTQHSNDV